MRDGKLILLFLAILVSFVVGLTLHLLQGILIPYVVAFFLSLIFTPLNGALRRRGVPTAVIILLVLVVVTAVLLVPSWIIYASAENFLESLPFYQGKLVRMTESLAAGLEAALPPARPLIERLRSYEMVEAAPLTRFLAVGVGSFLVFFGHLVLIPLFLVFLLLGSAGFPVKLGQALAPERADRIAAVLRNIEEQVRRYLMTKTLINLANGVLVTLLLTAFGVHFPLLWGFVTFIAHYIPQIGGVLSVGLPGLFFLVQFDSVGRALLVAVLNMALQFLIGNVIEPRVMGTRLNLSPLLVLVSLVFWGWLWGAWGMVLAVPIMATIRIVCANVPGLEPLAVLMSESVRDDEPAAPLQTSEEEAVLAHPPQGVQAPRAAAERQR